MQSSYILPFAQQCMCLVCSSPLCLPCAYSFVHICVVDLCLTFAGRGREGGICVDHDDQILTWYQSVCPVGAGTKCQQAPRTCREIVCGRGRTEAQCEAEQLLKNCGRYLPSLPDGDNFEEQTDDFRLSDYSDNAFYLFVGTYCCSICGKAPLRACVVSSANHGVGFRVRAPVIVQGGRASLTPLTTSCAQLVRA